MWDVKWTPEAEIQFYETLKYWTDNNNSSEYSKKIYLEVEHTTKLLSFSPYIGQEHEFNTEFTKIRKIVILKNFTILYRITDIVEIISFWNNNQDPKELKSIF